ncbi:hypothetical protein HARCEL1_00950 [Halococcoides cellulosivorans]|uniref:Uncharacterized protein n=1 Tax=Halococcoides cellulosivorans TaxID=1679096 RepID=A0A2R4WXX1_9EURY|nr:hypothetical protein HARCEL1_00950 [Halococcoides cellulosivorans]
MGSDNVRERAESGLSARRSVCLSTRRSGDAVPVPPERRDRPQHACARHFEAIRTARRSRGPVVATRIDTRSTTADRNPYGRQEENGA